MTRDDPYVQPEMQYVSPMYPNATARPDVHGHHGTPLSPVTERSFEYPMGDEHSPYVPSISTLPSSWGAPQTVYNLAPANLPFLSRSTEASQPELPPTHIVASTFFAQAPRELFVVQGEAVTLIRTETGWSLVKPTKATVYRNRCGWVPADNILEVAGDLLIPPDRPPPNSGVEKQVPVRKMDPPDVWREQTFEEWVSSRRVASSTRLNAYATRETSASSRSTSPDVCKSFSVPWTPLPSSPATHIMKHALESTNPRHPTLPQGERVSQICVNGTDTLVQITYPNQIVQRNVPSYMLEPIRTTPAKPSCVTYDGMNHPAPSLTTIHSSVPVFQRQSSPIPGLSLGVQPPQPFQSTVAGSESADTSTGSSVPLHSLNPSLPFWTSPATSPMSSAWSEFSGSSVESEEEEEDLGVQAPANSSPIIMDYVPLKLERKSSASELFKHPRFYLDDGNVRFQVGDKLFNVHRYFFDKHAPGLLLHKQPMVILPNVDPIDFERLLTVFYPSELVVHDLTNSVEWASVLVLASFWNMRIVRRLAIIKLGHMLDDDPVERLVLGRALGWDMDANENGVDDGNKGGKTGHAAPTSSHFSSSSSSIRSSPSSSTLDTTSGPRRHSLDIQHWCFQAYEQLSTRDSVLTTAEARRLGPGVQDVLRIWDAQNRVKQLGAPPPPAHSPLVCPCNTAYSVSQPPPRAFYEYQYDVRKIVRDVFFHDSVSPYTSRTGSPVSMTTSDRSQLRRIRVQDDQAV